MAAPGGHPVAARQRSRSAEATSMPAPPASATAPSGAAHSRTHGAAPATGRRQYTSPSAPSPINRPLTAVRPRSSSRSGSGVHCGASPSFAAGRWWRPPSAVAASSPPSRRRVDGPPGQVLAAQLPAVEHTVGTGREERPGAGHQRRPGRRAADHLPVARTGAVAGPPARLRYLPRVPPKPRYPRGPGAWRGRSQSKGEATY
jgi:hypothetical protein